MELSKEKPEGLALLRVHFPDNQISKLPKPTKAQTDAVKNDYKAGIRCELCGGWHHPNVVHLDYVGHAALTDRLLDCDPEWNWEPLALDESGAPKLDENGGMWIRLTVCGVSRLGYGHPDGKTGGDAIKEVIGDALRNAAMRFGAALDLWHKGNLHMDMPEPEPQDNPKAEKPKAPTPVYPFTVEMEGDNPSNEQVEAAYRKLYGFMSKAPAKDINQWITLNSEMLDLLKQVSDKAHKAVYDLAAERKGA